MVRTVLKYRTGHWTHQRIQVTEIRETCHYATSLTW